MTQSSPIVLASRTINRSGDLVTVELIQPRLHARRGPHRLADRANDHHTARYNEVTSTAMRQLAEASTTLARIRASKRL